MVFEMDSILNSLEGNEHWKEVILFMASEK